MERQITISLDEYNKLIDMHTRREELPEKIEVKKFTSKWWKWLKRASYSLFHYNRNVEQQKLIKRCINETASIILDNLINGYWRGDLSEYFKDGNFDVTLRSYKDTSYSCVMEWLDKKKQRMEKKIFDFSEALRRMKEGKKVRRKIFADGTYAYIDKNYIGSEALMYNSVGRAAPVLWLLPETIFATDWEEV